MSAHEDDGNGISDMMEDDHHSSSSHHHSSSSSSRRPHVHLQGEDNDDDRYEERHSSSSSSSRHHHRENDYYEEEPRESMSKLLNDLKDLKAKGYPLHKSYNLNSSYSELKDEVKLGKEWADKSFKLMIMRLGLMNVVKTEVETFNFIEQSKAEGGMSWFPNMCVLKLNGFDHYVGSQIGQFDDALIKVHDRYFSKFADMNPLLQCGLILLGLSYDFHSGNKRAEANAMAARREADNLVDQGAVDRAVERALRKIQQQSQGTYEVPTTTADMSAQERYNAAFAEDDDMQGFEIPEEVQPPKPRDKISVRPK